MNFTDSLRLSIALGLTIFLVLLRFDSDRIMRSDYFRSRYPWVGPRHYYGLVVLFAIGIAIILPKRPRLALPGSGRSQGPMLPLMLGFAPLASSNARGLRLPLVSAASCPAHAARSEPPAGRGAPARSPSELQFRSIVLGMLIFAGIEARHRR